MATFPKLENDVLALAQYMIAGYTAYPLIFPSADIPALQAALTEVQTDIALALNFRAAAQDGTDQKDDAVEAMVAKMLTELTQAEVDVASDPVKLAMIGWGERTAAQRAHVPHQPRRLEAVLQGPGTVFLDWKAPVHRRAAPVRTYVINRRKQPEGGGGFGAWEQIGIALETEKLLTGQPLRCEVEYRIIAVNNPGQSKPSNSAMVVL